MGVKRRYDSSKRQEQARRTRWEILQAAKDLLLERGYAATTMASIADRAGVSTETVYTSIGPKREVVKQVVDVAIAGDDEPVPIAERDFVQRIGAATSVKQKFAIFAEHAVDAHSRTAPLWHVLEQGAGSEQELAELLAGLEQQRVVGMTMATTDLRAQGALRDDMTDAEVRDVLWASISGGLYRQLVLERGWPEDRFRDWLAEFWVSMLGARRRR